MPPRPQPPVPLADLIAAHKAKGVKYGLAAYVDIHGVSKCKVVPIDHWPQMFAGSELFTGAALDGVPQQVNEEEVSAHPDPATATICSWRPEVAWFASDLWCHGKPFPACSRVILKQQMEAAKQMGFTFNLGIEAEFFVLKDGENGKPIPSGARDGLAKAAYDVVGILDSYPWLDELVTAMNDLGWDVYSFDHEDAPGQFEIDFDYADALTTADRLTYFRLLAKEITGKHGFYPTFMPKPFADLTGSGSHHHLSLWDIEGKDNLFLDKSDPRGLSSLALSFLAGILDQPRHQQLQAPDPAQCCFRLHLGADLCLLRQQQSDQHAAHPAGRRASRVPGGRHRLQSIPGRGADTRGRPRRHPREPRPRRAEH